jgi:hypothetical protein
MLHTTTRTTYRALIAAAALALTGAALSGVHRPAAAHADGYCDTDYYQACWGPSFLQSSVGPGEVVLDWDFSLDTPAQVVITRGETTIATLTVGRDEYGDPDSPTQYTDSDVEAGAVYDYTVCFTYPSPAGIATGCSDTPAGPVPPKSSSPGNTGGSGSGGKGSSGGAATSGGASKPQQQPQPLAPSAFHVTARTDTTVTIGWTAGANGATALNCIGPSPDDMCGWSFPAATYVPGSTRGDWPSATATSFTYTGLLPGHIYQMQGCEAQSGAGGNLPTCSGWFTFASSPSLPTDLTATHVDANGVTLTWRSNNTDDARLQFALYRDGMLVPLPAAKDTAIAQASQLLLATGLDGRIDSFSVDTSATYSYKVCAVAAQGTAAETSTCSAPLVLHMRNYFIAAALQAKPFHP